MIRLLKCLFDLLYSECSYLKHEYFFYIPRQIKNDMMNLKLYFLENIVHLILCIHFNLFLQSILYIVFALVVLHTFQLQVCHASLH